MSLLFIPLVGAHQPPPRPVEQGLADVNPLGLSFRRVERDARRDTGWAEVFRVAPAAPGGPGQFARRSGGLTAVFPRSEYIPARGGRLLVTVPAGTRFIIGEGPPPPVAPPPPRPPAPSTVSRAASTAVRSVASTPATQAVPAPPPAPGARHPAPAPPPPGMLTDEGYRARRIGELLTAAATAPPR